MPIVEAVGVAHVTLGQVSKALRAAMVAAVEEAHQAGISDPEEIRRRMLKARSTAQQTNTQ